MIAIVATTRRLAFTLMQEHERHEWSIIIIITIIIFVVVSCYCCCSIYSVRVAVSSGGGCRYVIGLLYM